MRSMVEGAGLDSVSVAAPFRRSATPSPAVAGEGVLTAIIPPTKSPTNR
jgi:hypothetical protein